MSTVLLEECWNRREHLHFFYYLFYLKNALVYVSGGDCHRIKGLPSEAFLKPASYDLDPRWLSSARDCNVFANNFASRLPN